MSQPTHSRRRFLAGATGTALALGVAGCNTLAQSDDETGDDGSTGTDGTNDEQNNNHDDAEEHGDDGHTNDDGHDDGDTDNEEEHNDEDDHGDEHGHNHDEGKLQEPSAEAEVLLQTEGEQHHFAPHAVWIEPGGTVTWKNKSGQHDAVAYHPDNGEKPLRIPENAEPWSTGLLTENGETVTHTFETEGVYDYFCTPHEHMGMVGTIIVGEPDAHGQGGLEEPQDSLPEGAMSELADLGKQVNEALGHTH